MNLEQVQAFELPQTEQSYGWKDNALYALGLGYGSDPLDEAELRFVYEANMRTVPSMCCTLGHPGFWLNAPALEIDWVRVLHAEQSFTLHNPLPPEGRIRADYRIVGVTDKGADKGAILALEKRLVDAASGVPYYTVLTYVFLRGDGGQGGFGHVPETPPAFVGSEPDLLVDLPTLPQLALLYRLNGDTNPLHADPAVAAAAGFPAPILHGLATMGVATRALLRAVCDNDPARMGSMFVRFSAPVYPGETIRTEIHRTDAGARFRCRVLERDVVVLDRGSVTLVA